MDEPSLKSRVTVDQLVEAMRERGLRPLRLNGKALLPIVQGGMGVLESSTDRTTRSPVLAGKVCGECGNATVIHKDGCEFCTACGDIGQCG